MNIQKIFIFIFYLIFFINKLVAKEEEKPRFSLFFNHLPTQPETPPSTEKAMTDSPQGDAQDHSLKITLQGILYHTPHDWRVWINHMPIQTLGRLPQGLPEDMLLQSVGPDNIRLVWRKKIINLSIDQTFHLLP